MIVYKIVSVNGPYGRSDSLTSFAALPPVRYHLDKWVSPDVGAGPLAAFETLYDAKVYLALTRPWSAQLWESEAIPAAQEADGLWYPNRHASRLVKSSLPAGTILCAQIKLLRRTCDGMIYGAE